MGSSVRRVPICLVSQRDVRMESYPNMLTCVPRVAERAPAKLMPRTSHTGMMMSLEQMAVSAVLAVSEVFEC